MNINDRWILTLIAKQIDDSVTWCRFSQVNKKCNQIAKLLLVVRSRNIPIIQEYTELPNGKRHGLFEEWYYNGNNLIKTYYKDDCLHGVLKEWNHQGKIRYQAEHRNNKLHGICKKYNYYGALLSEREYKDDKLVRTIYAIGD